MAACDAVLDQFNLGEYGTLTLEAMAMAKPVIFHYQYGNPPPCLKALSAQDIARQMAWVMDRPDEAAALGRQARQWVQQTHGPDAVIPKFLDVLRAVLAGQAVPQFPKVMG